MSIEINNLKFEYSDFSLSVNLNIKRGEFLSVLGPSGSGKTTLLRLLAGFIRPSSGSIIMNGRDITNLPTASRNIGMVFQDYALFPHMNVYKNIAYGLETRKLPGHTVEKRVSELLETVNLGGYENRRIDQLSGGEKQRVALARAIAPEPELLLFDEPLSALDVKLRKKLRREIKSIQKKLGFTAVYVTHDQEEAMSISDFIAVMNEGRITQQDTAENIYNRPADYFTADFIGTINRYKGKLFRPESCRTSSEKNGSSFYIDAVVETAEYTGGSYICEAYADNELITFYSNDKIENGSAVIIEVDRKDLISL